MKKKQQSLSTSLLITKLYESGTGILEGNYKSILGIDDMKFSSSDSEENFSIHFSIHFSDFAGNYLGKYYVRSSKPKETFINCELLTSENGSVYNQLKSFGDRIHIVLFPFKNSLGGYAGRFIADWGGPSAEIDKEQLTT